MVSFLFYLVIPFSFGSQLIDHKGANNPFDWKSSGCAAQQLYALNYPFPDNTLESIETSFGQGADAVEIDLRVSADNDIVLFQEESVDCMTNGKGRVRDLKVSELKALDFGYWLHLKKGEYPLRGQGIGRITTLREVLRRFPRHHFLLNPKDKYPAATQVLVKILKEFKDRDYSEFTFWGEPRAYHQLKKSLPPYGPFIANHHQSYRCWEAWKWVGFLGIFPDACESGQSISLNLEEWSVNWWQFPFPFLHQAKAKGLSVWLFNVSDPHVIRGLLIYTSGIIASDLSARPLGGAED